MSQTEASDILVKNLMEKPSLTENKTTNGDEQIQGMSLTMSIETSELSDPAILAVSEIRKFRYTREQLIKLKDSPASLKKPDFLDSTDVLVSSSSVIFDPERNNFDRKKSETPTENGSRGGDLDHRRRPGDPRERIRKENDGIVLSPQRRSFNSGCFVPVRETTRTNRSHSPIGKGDSSHSSVREIQPGNRRIGSGRIINNWDYGEKPEGDNDYSFRSSHRNSSEREDKYGERRTFGRDFENKDKGRRNNNSRYNDQRRISENRDEEPEWFSGGPMSQNDTIELRGFDEPEKPSKKKLSPAKAKRAQEWANKKKESISEDPKKESEASKAVARSSTPNALQAGAQGDKKKEEGHGNGDSGKEKPGQGMDDQSFNLDDFLKSDNIPLFANGVGGDGDNTKSRFSAWFKRESPVKNQHDSRRNSLQEDHIIKNIIKDISNEPSAYVPGDSEAYFAPISPAGNTGTNVGSHIGPSAGSKPLNIMEMLQRSKHQAPLHADLPPNIKGSQMAGKILSLDELEARIRQSGGDQQPPKTTQQKPEEDMTAFNRLLAQVSGGHAVTANGLVQQKNSAPMSLMEMLSHSQQQDEARMAGHFLGNTPNMANDIAIKLQQVQNQVQQRQQMELLNKFINPTNINMQQLRTSPLQDMGVQQSRELLSRPEAQAILQGLKRGDLTPQHLYQQLANPALQPRHREMLLAILKLHQAVGVGPSPRVLSPVPPHPMFSQQQQQLRVSPLPPNSYCVSPIMATSPNTLTVPAMHQRIPSPRELQVHTQNILQRALIKKKLEEQQENFRKREMQQRGQSPNNGNTIPNAIVGQQPVKSQASPTPLAFTPTSVLRKMTAEKDDSKDGIKSSLIDSMKAPQQGRALTGQRPMRSDPHPQQWNPHFAVPKPPVGRPIVKANANFQGQPEQFFNQQRLINQQQQQRKSGQGPNSQQLPQNPQTSTYPNHPGASTLMSSLQQQQHTHPYPNSNQQFSQQLTQQQLRAQHQQHSRPINAPPSSQSQQPQSQPQTQGQQLNMGQQSNFAHHQPQSNWHQFLNAQNTRGNQLGRGGITDGDLSPTTTDQLARWFSPDLLERARGGELPSTANLAQHVLSLEEIERQTAPPVHN